MRIYYYKIKLLVSFSAVTNVPPSLVLIPWKMGRLLRNTSKISCQISAGTNGTPGVATCARHALKMTVNWNSSFLRKAMVSYSCPTTPKVFRGTQVASPTGMLLWDQFPMPSRIICFTMSPMMLGSVPTGSLATSINCASKIAPSNCNLQRIGVVVPTCISTVRQLTHPRKKSVLNVPTFGNRMDASDVQALNARPQTFMSFPANENSTLARLVHPAKADGQIKFKCSGNVMLVRLLHPAKADRPILASLSGKSMLVRLLHP